MGKQEITAENIHTKTDKEILAVIGCFGRMWNPWEQLCNGGRPCMAQARCLHHLAMETIPQEALERGAYEPNHETGEMYPRPERLDLNEMAPEFQTDPRALMYALQYSKDPKLGLPVIQPNGMLAPSMSGPPQLGPGMGTPAAPVPAPEPVKAEVEVEEPDPEALDEVLEELDDQPSGDEESSIDPAVEPEQDFRAENDVETVEEEEEEMATKKATKKKAGAKKAARAKLAPKVAPKAKGPKPLPAAPKTAKEKPEKMSKDDFAARLEKDREKHPLAIGTVLTHAERGGETHSVQVTSEGYKYKGKVFATLGEASRETGNIMATKQQAREDGSRPDGERYTAKSSLSKWFTNLGEELAKSAKGKKGKK
jgi:hypothetical protein